MNFRNAGGYIADGLVLEDICGCVRAAAEKPLGFGNLALQRSFCHILLMWLCLLLPTASSESSFGPSVAFLGVKKLSGDAVTPLLLPHRMVMSLPCILSGSGNEVFFGPVSREVLPRSFALMQLKGAATLSLENAVPLGSSRGMVAPSFLCRQPSDMAALPRNVPCSRADSEPQRALCYVGRLPPVAPCTTLWGLRRRSVLLFFNVFVF